MNRRTYLASLAALLPAGGCLGRATSQSAPGNGDRWVAVSNVERRPPADPEQLDEDERPTGLRISVEVVRRGITAQEPARVELTYTNGGSDTLRLNIDPESPDPLPSEAADPGLILLSDAYDPTKASDGCWHPEEDGFPRPAVAYQHPIEPEGSESLAYDVWAAPQQAAPCLQPGDYRFEPLYGAFTLSVEQDRTTQ